MAGPAAVAARCPICGEPVGERDRYCEGCGADLLSGTALPESTGARSSPVSGTVPPGGVDAPGEIARPEGAGPGRQHPDAGGPGQPTQVGTAAPGPAVAGGSAGTSWIRSGVTGADCPLCGGLVGPDGYCGDCGARRPAGPPHAELTLGSAAAVTDLGKRHAHNEDAVGLGVAGALLVAVVCDGVSTSDRPDTASHAAVDAALPALLGRLVVGPDDHDAALLAAGAAGQAGAALAAGPVAGANPPSTTFVAAVVAPGRVTVGWVGDSRAYWLPDPAPAEFPAGEVAAGPGAGGVLDAAPACLTVDDALPGGLLRWLGADAPDVRPHLASFAVHRPGRVVVCSDGLSRYLPDPVRLASATANAAGAGAADAEPAAAGGALAAAGGLVRLVLDAGGVDNVAVAVLPVPAGETVPGDPVREAEGFESPQPPQGDTPADPAAGDPAEGVDA